MARPSRNCCSGYRSERASECGLPFSIKIVLRSVKNVTISDFCPCRLNYVLSSCRFGVAVQDFGKSWTSGLAFLAVIKSIDSSLVDMRKALLRTARENLEDAFRIAHYSLGIPRLLEPEGNKEIAIFV